MEQKEVASESHNETGGTDGPDGNKTEGITTNELEGLHTKEVTVSSIIDGQEKPKKKLQTILVKCILPSEFERNFPANFRAKRQSNFYNGLPENFTESAE